MCSALFVWVQPKKKTGPKKIHFYGAKKNIFLSIFSLNWTILRPYFSQKKIFKNITRAIFSADFWFFYRLGWKNQSGSQKAKDRARKVGQVNDRSKMMYEGRSHRHRSIGPQATPPSLSLSMQASRPTVTLACKRAKKRQVINQFY